MLEAQMREVQSDEWQSVHQELKLAGFIRFDYLTAAHDGGDEFEVFSKLSNSVGDTSVLIKTKITGQLQTLIEIYPIADFHERELHQMFGVTVEHRPDIGPAFATDFSGYPLRRDFGLTKRSQTSWPGTVEPDEKARRRSTLPPGVFESWN